MIRLSNTLKRLMKVGAILFGLAFIVSGIIGIRQDDSFLPTKGVIQSMERTYDDIPSQGIMQKTQVNCTKSSQVAMNR